jgi:hypothetical protein
MDSVPVMSRSCTVALLVVTVKPDDGVSDVPSGTPVLVASGHSVGTTRNARVSVAIYSGWPVKWSTLPLNSVIVVPTWQESVYPKTPRWKRLLLM